MATVLPFAGMRPPPDLAAQVAAPPYDVINSEQARKLAADNPHSFLHISKPEIDLDASVDVHSDQVYSRASENFNRFRSHGTLVPDSTPAFYLYRQSLGQHSQTGIVGLVSADEYEQDIIRKHELTRPDKENDRVRHMAAIQAQTGPVFLTYRAQAGLTAMTDTAASPPPLYDFTSDGVRHEFWMIEDEGTVDSIRTAFDAVPLLYVADGHHRSAAAVRYRAQRREDNPGHRGDEPYNYFMAVLFPHDELNILGYHRLVRDLGNYEHEEFVRVLGEQFNLEPCNDNVMPQKAGEFSFYLPGQWFRVSGLADDAPGDIVSGLDVSLLQTRILSPLLGIDDPRTDERIDFLGGIHGQRGLEHAVESGEYAAAFACYPVDIQALMAVADQGKLMPPKSTWFEPKLKSGLVVHKI